MDHIGVGETHINSLLAALEIKGLNPKTIQKRERELAKAFETVKTKSCEDALAQEVAAHNKHKTRLLNTIIKTDVTTAKRYSYFES